MFKFNLHTGEELRGHYRQTEWVLVIPAFLVFIAIYLPIAFLLQYDILATYKNWLLLWTLAVLLWATHKYLLWLLNSYLITNQRIIRINYQTVFLKRVEERPFGHISNITYKTTGFFSSLCGFGDVEINSIGLPESFVLWRVKDPGAVKDILWEIQTSTAQSGKPVMPTSQGTEPAEGLKNSDFFEKKQEKNDDWLATIKTKTTGGKKIDPKRVRIISKTTPDNITSFPPAKRKKII